MRREPSIAVAQRQPSTAALGSVYHVQPVFFRKSRGFSCSVWPIFGAIIRGDTPMLWQSQIPVPRKLFMLTAFGDSVD